MLVVVAVLQLAFPVSFFVYENIMTDRIVEKGKSYTLDYTCMTHFNREFISLDTKELYTVGYDWDYKKSKAKQEDKYYIPYNSLMNYHEVGIREKEGGGVSFFDVEKEKDSVTEYNRFYVYNALQIDLDDYEFVRPDFGLKEMYDLCLLLSDDSTNDITFEEFMHSEDGYYNGLWHINIEGKITLKVYDGYAKISEIYMGDELVLRYK